MQFWASPLLPPCMCAHKTGSHFSTGDGEKNRTVVSTNAKNVMKTVIIGLMQQSQFEKTNVKLRAGRMHLMERLF